VELCEGGICPEGIGQCTGILSLANDNKGDYTEKKTWRATSEEICQHLERSKDHGRSHRVIWLVGPPIWKIKNFKQA